MLNFYEKIGRSLALHSDVMRRVIFSTFLVFGFLVLPSIVGGVQAASLKFNPSSVSSSAGQTFQVDVIVSAGTKEVLGVDALMQYDTNMLEVQGISDGTYLTVGTKDTNDSGKIYIAGVVDSPGEFVTGEGVLAKITFKVKSGGQSEVKFICDVGETNESNVSENSTDAPDLIECATNGKVAVTTSGSTETSSSGSSGGTTTNPTQLPRSGVVENMIFAAIAGAVLLILGGGAKHLIR